MRTLHPAAVEFIEQISLIAESAGFPRIGGRIVGLLIVMEEPLSVDQLVSLLQVSRGSLSTNTRLLESRGVIHRVSHLGEQKDLFEVDSSFPERMIERSQEGQRAMHRVAMATRRRLPDQCVRAKDALRRIEEFTAVSVQTTENMLEAWHTAERRPAGTPADSHRKR